MMDLHDSLDRMASAVRPDDRLDDLLSGTTVSSTSASRTTGEMVHRPRRLVVPVAAACVGLLAGTGLLLASREVQQPEPVASEPVPPITAVPPGALEPLFVLPSDPGIAVHGGSLGSGSMSGPGPGIVTLLGRPDGAGYRDLMGVTVSTTDPLADDADLDLVTTSLATGPVSILDEAAMSHLVQRRDDRWVSIDVRSAQRSAALEVLADGRLEGDDALVLDGTSGYDVLDTLDTTERRVASSSFITDDGIVVSMATATTPLEYATDAVRAERIIVRGHEGWRLSFGEQTGSPAVDWISWMETPTVRGSVFAPTTVPTERLLEVADGLVVVDYPTWTRATDRLSPTPDETGDTIPGGTVPATQDTAVPALGALLPPVDPAVPIGTELPTDTSAPGTAG